MVAEEDVENGDKDRLLPDLSPKDERYGIKESKLLTYAQCYFVTIAATLGTGILGLPVKLANSGFTPFVIVFVLGFFAQVLVVYYFVDILQKAFVIKKEKFRKDSMLSACEDIPLNEEINDTSADELDREFEVNRQGSSSSVQISYNLSKRTSNSLIYYPSLHSLAELFLWPGLQQIFDLAIVLVFVSCLISYSLAGSQAYAQIGHFELLYVIPIFTWICSFIIIAAMYVGYFVKQEISEDFWSAGEPFLLGTVAIGGIINIMPMVFTKIHLQSSQIANFRLSINCGLATCMILNILWCYAVLEVVPQKECMVNSGIKTSYFTSNDSSIISVPNKLFCSNNGSLEWAEANGKISIIPLTEILHTKYTEFTWIAFLIQIFVMISITVSFLTLGAALRHMLEGWFDSLYSFSNKSDDQSITRTYFTRQSLLKKAGLLVIFGFVFTIAMFNPKAFIIVMEKVTSLIINLETFIVVTIMLHNAHAHKYRHLGIPLRLPRGLHVLSYLVAFYFLVAIGYDIYEIVLHAVSTEFFQRHKQPHIMVNHNKTGWFNDSAHELLSSHSRRWRVNNLLGNTSTLG